jgi:hypothetical protein
VFKASFYGVRVALDEMVMKPMNKSVHVTYKIGERQTRGRLLMPSITSIEACH